MVMVSGFPSKENDFSGAQLTFQAQGHKALAPPVPPNGVPIYAKPNVTQNLSRQDVTYQDKDRNGTVEIASYRFKGFDTARDNQLDGDAPLIAKVVVDRKEKTIAITSVNLEGKDTGTLLLKHRQGQYWETLRRTGDMLGGDRFTQWSTEFGSNSHVKMVSDPKIGVLEFSLFSPKNGGFVLAARNETTDLPVKKPAEHSVADMTYLGVDTNVAPVSTLGRLPNQFLQNLFIQRSWMGTPPARFDFATKREAIVTERVKDQRAGEWLVQTAKDNWLYTSHP